jgi:hypothetical protein
LTSTTSPMLPPHSQTKMPILGDFFSIDGNLPYS